MEKHTENISIPIGFQEQQPPPYSATLPGYSALDIPPRAFPNPNFNPNSSELSSVDRFSHILVNSQFSFYSTSKIGFTARTAVVQIRDSNDRPLISCLTNPGTTVSHGEDQSLQIGAVFTMTDSSGQTLLVGKQNGQSITVTSGGQVLGILDGLGLCSSDMSVKSVMGDCLFQIVSGTGDSGVSSSSNGCFSCSSSSEFTFISNGIPIGRVGKSSTNPNKIEFTFLSQNLDSRTKALGLFAAYLTYSNFFADTSFGPVGYRGLTKKFLMCFCLFTITVMLLSILVPVIVFSQV